MEYPRRIRQRDSDFIFRFRFLFQRFTPSRYYHGVVLMTKNTLLPLVPIIIADYAPGQIVLSAAILLLFTCIAVFFLPWRIDIANYIDGTVSLLLVFLIVVAGVSVD